MFFDFGRRPFSFVVCNMYVFYPAISSDWNWECVQRVWDRWQTLNASVLAFLASVIALNISKYHEKKQREWSFIAAKAFLPSALSELSEYFKLSANLYIEAYRELINNSSRNYAPLTSPIPKLPTNYVETFRQCINYAEPDVGLYMANILGDLQIHHARMTELNNNLANPGQMLLFKSNVMSYIYCLGKLYALVGKLFPFARGQEIFDTSPLVWDDLRNSYGLLDIEIEDIEGLVDFTKRTIERLNNDNPI